jgi:hypothetical protein
MKKLGRQAQSAETRTSQPVSGITIWADEEQKCLEKNARSEVRFVKLVKFYPQDGTIAVTSATSPLPFTFTSCYRLEARRKNVSRLGYGAASELSFFTNLRLLRRV